MNLNSANNTFSNFKIKSKKAYWIGNAVIGITVALSGLLVYSGSLISKGTLMDLPISTRVISESRPKTFLSRLEMFKVKEVMANTLPLRKSLLAHGEKTLPQLLGIWPIFIFALFVALLIILFIKRRSLFKKVVSVGLIISLVASWLLSGWPAIWNYPRIPPKIREAKAAFDERTETNVQGASLSSPYQATLAVPTGTTNGDIMFTWIGSYSATVTTNAAWTLIGSNTTNSDKYYLYARVASSEPASYVWTFSGTSTYKATCTTYIASSDFSVTNVSTDLTVSNTPYRTSNGTNRAASFSVPNANSPLLFFGGVYSTSSKTQTPPTNPGTFAEDYDTGSTTPDFWLEIASYIWAGSGTSGDIDSTISATLTTKHAFAVALKPPAATVSTGGGQKAGMAISSTDNYVGGEFIIEEGSGGSRNVTGITIAEQGTVNAQTNLDNIKLYYNSDTSAPYDCASKAYTDGDLNQFGSTDTDGFSAANGTSAFTGSVGISTTSTMCVYVVLDIGSGAGNGDTLEIQITNPSTDVTVSSGSVKPITAVLISGITTIMNPGVIGTLGKSADGWGGVIPVYMELVGVDQASYPYARAQVVTPASETYYTTMTWDSGDNRYEGAIYIGSWYCNACADNHTGSFAVTVQLDNNSGFPSIDYSDSVGNFATTVTRRRSSIGGTTNYAKYAAVWSTDHWNVQAYDFDLYTDSGTITNAVIGMAFHPTTADISITQVRLSDGAWITTQSAVDGTGNGWWWDSSTHSLYVRVASLTTTAQNLDFEFTSSTDLWATRFDNVQTTDMGERDFWNGLYINNRYYTTSIYGSSLNVAFSGTDHDNDGVQAESRSHRDGTLENVTTDCMERLAVHVGPDGGGTPSVARQDNSVDYSYDVKWKANDFANWIQSENDDQMVLYETSDDQGSCTGGNIQAWAQYCDNQIAAQRTQTFYAGKPYLKNYYKFINNDTSSHYYDMVWGREQWLNDSAASTNDRGMTYDSNPKTVEWSGVDDENPDQPTSAHPWFAAYDITGTNLMDGVCYKSNDIATNNYFLSYAPLQSGSTAAEWPIDHGQTGTDAADTFFNKSFGVVGAGSSVNFTFWQFNYYGSSFADLKSTIDTNCTALNAPTYNQSAFRWFSNDNSVSVGSPIVSQDTAMSSETPPQGTPFRMRVLLHVDGSDLASSGQNFKLQIASKVGASCDTDMDTTDESYSDLVTTTGAIRYYDNTSATDNTALTADVTNDPSHSGHTKVTQTYKDLDTSDSNINFTNSEGAIPVGQDGEWDFTIVDNSATEGTDYCLRIVKADDTVLDTYSVVPEFTTVPENPLLLFGLYPLFAGFLKKLRRK